MKDKIIKVNDTNNIMLIFLFGLEIHSSSITLWSNIEIEWFEDEYKRKE